MRFAVMLVLILAIPICYADAYKCKNVSGKIEYQDQPCATGKKLDLSIDKAPIDPEAKNISTDSIEQFNKLISQRKVAVGMTTTMVKRAWGEPHRVNTTIGTGGRSEQWVYDRGSYVIDYVYLDNGIVKNIQISK